MIVIDLIKIGGNKFLYYYFLNNLVTIEEFEGFPANFLLHFQKLQNQLIIELVQEFISMEGNIEHTSKEIFSYKETIGNLRNFIEWGIKNEKMPEKITTFVNLKIIAALNSVVDLVSDKNEKKKDLIFVVHCVTINSNHRINVYKD
jgi:hypothetical protein